MSFPNPELGSFEGENDAWCLHVTQSFVQGVTLPQLETEGCDPAHAAYAHMAGMILCVMMDDFSEDLIAKLRLNFEEAIMRGKGLGVEFPSQHRPHLTVLSGGKSPTEGQASCPD